MDEPDGRAALEELFWRAEILQALFWMHGEGLASEVEAGDLARFLAAAPETVAGQMDRLAEEGELERVATPGHPAVRYRLSPAGMAGGARSFHDEFSELTRPAHGECEPGCWCLDPEHAGEPCPSHPEEAHGTHGD